MRKASPPPASAAPRTADAPGPYLPDAEFVAFLQRVLPRLRLRWPGFRKVRGQVRKRVARRLRVLGLEGLDEYEARLETSPKEWKVLQELCRITISRFYRDRAVFDALRDPLLPELARSAAARGERTVRVWCAGCASGEEPYSLSLAWTLDAARRAPAAELRIVATDVDEHLLERARAARYEPGTLKELPADWIPRAFDRIDGLLRLQPPLRTRVTFLLQDIRTEMPPGAFDAILCRNLVFTYFEPSLQAELLRGMLERLTPRGLLVVGAHETLPPGDWPLEPARGALPILRLVRPVGPTATGRGREGV